MTDLMKDLNGIDEVALGQLREAEKTGEGVQLPFPVANFFVYNGDARQKTAAKDCPVLYFGGFAGDAHKITELVDAGDAPAPLAKWYPFEGAGEKGSWDGVGSRLVTISAITHRARWTSQDGRSGPNYDAEAGLTRRHLQLLCLLYNDSKPWSYAVITAKGYQAQNLLGAISAWGKAIAPFRKELNAVALPLSAFALTIGTTGAEPKFVSVGKGNSTSKITPIEAVIPEGLTADMVGKRFIGAQNLRANAEHLDQARDWLAAWKTGAVTRDEAPAREEETEIPF